MQAAGLCRRILALCGAATLVLTCTATVAHGALPAVAVHVTTVPLADIGQHRGVTVTATCPADTRLVGGGSELRDAADQAILPTNGLVLGASAPSSGAAPVDAAVTGGAVDPGSWMTIANYTGVSEAGNQASTFALCKTSDGPAHTAVATARRTGTVGAQEAAPPNLATATCAAPTRLLGGGATTSTPDQVNDGVTPGNDGNLKPLGSYPSDAAGVPAAVGSTSADSWSAYGSAGVTSATDTVSAYALCSTDADTPPVRVARTDVDGPDAQTGTTTTAATATCPVDTRLLGGGYRVDESVAGVGTGLQPQQGYHLRASRPGGALAPSADADADPDAWTALVQAGGQNLATGRHMTTAGFALCATQPPPPDSADLAVAIVAPDPVTVGDEVMYSVTVSNAGPSTATDVQLAQALPDGLSFVSASATSGSCTQAAGTVGCALGPIASGDGATVTVHALATVAGTLTSGVAVSSDVADPHPANDSASWTTHAQLAVRATPTLTASSPARATLGSTISDSATLSGASAPTGTITFRLYGPDALDCALAIATSTAPVTANGSYASAGYATAATGTYRWSASYDGDGSNEPAQSACSQPAQAVSVKAAPVLTLRASGGGVVGATTAASATLSGGTIVTGTIAFRVYGPGDTGCATPIATSSAAVSGNGIYAAPAIFARTAGTYRWVAEYGGDASNFAEGPTACADPAAAVTVTASTAPPPPPSTPPLSLASAFRFAGHRIDARRRIRLLLRSPGRGRFTATATAHDGRVAYRFGSRTATIRGRATITLTIAPGAHARSELRSHGLRVGVAVRFRAANGATRTRTIQIAVPRRAAS